MKELREVSRRYQIYCERMIQVNKVFYPEKIVALHNTSVICPEFSVYLVNTYRKPARLYIYLTPMEHLFCHRKAPGTTQGDNCASVFYSCSLIPLMLELPTVPPDLTDPDLA